MTYFGRSHVKFQAAVNIGRRIISELHHGPGVSQVKDNSLSQIEKLAELKKKGILTEGEFQAKKKQLLGL